MHNIVVTKNYILLVDMGTSPIDDGEMIYSYTGDEITYKCRDSKPGTYRRVIGYRQYHQDIKKLHHCMLLPELDTKYLIPYGFDIIKIDGSNLIGEYLYNK